MRNTLNQRLADTTEELFNKKDSITFAELARAEFSVASTDLVAIVLKRRSAIRKTLQDRGIDCALVNDFYFENHTVEGPDTLVEAKKCIPFQSGNPTAAVGLVHANGRGTSLIFRVTEEASMSAHGGGVRSSIEKTANAIERGTISDQTARAMIRKSAKMMRPRISAASQSKLGTDLVALMG